MRQLPVLVLLAISCLPKTEKDFTANEAKLSDTVESKSDTVPYKVLEEPPSIRRDTLLTDSSFVETVYYEDLNSIREFNRLNARDIVYYTDYYFTNHKVKARGVFSSHYCAGVWKYYDEHGTLSKEIDFDSGTKTLYNLKQEPFDSVFLQMKSKADSTLIAYYGFTFFKKHIKWDPNQSYYYSKNDSGVWFEIPEEEPEEFLFRYFLLFDQAHRFSCIEFGLDRTGRITNFSDTQGIKMLKANGEFIDNNQAIEIARENG